MNEGLVGMLPGRGSWDVWDDEAEPKPRVHGGVVMPKPTVGKAHACM